MHNKVNRQLALKSHDQRQANSRATATL